LVEQLSPTLLDELLHVLHVRGVASAEVPTEHGPLRVVFAPETPSELPAGDEVTPGGWKSPTRLDADPLDDERSTP
jgi:hypothetical protein